jgi:hypothetical protein
MVAVSEARCSAELVRELLAHGAAPDARSRMLSDLEASVVRLALGGGDSGESIGAAGVRGSTSTTRPQKVTPRCSTRCTDATCCTIEADHAARAPDRPGCVAAGRHALPRVRLARAVADRPLRRRRAAARPPEPTRGTCAGTPLLRAVALGSAADVDAILANNPPLEERRRLAAHGVFCSRSRPATSRRRRRSARPAPISRRGAGVNSRPCSTRSRPIRRRCWSG